MARFSRSLALLACALLSGLATAQTRVPGTQTYYSARQDPITDVNTSSVFIPEVNDTEGSTVFTVRCSDDGEPEVWAALATKNDLLSEDEAYQGLKPALTLRLGDDAPIVLRDRDMTSVVDANDEVLTRRIGLQGEIVQTVIRGLNAGKRLAVRVNRRSGGQALTYIFPAAGFSTAWTSVNRCMSKGAVSIRTPPPTLAPTASASLPAPKFTEWYFTTCRDATTGVARAGLLAGRTHLCDLVIETVPNGLQPVSAEFRYELEYREGSAAGKLILPGIDRWTAGSTGVKFRQDGNRLVFTVPLNVRARANRVYTSINVTGNIIFNNGTSKRVYEPLPIRLN